MKINKSTLSLNGLKFNSKIGLFEFERKNGNNFVINISVDIDKIFYDDQIKGTVDYGELFSIIEFEMSKTTKLIETVAHKISSRVHAELKNIKLCKIEIIKKNPPLEGNLDSSSFLLETTK